MMSKAPIAHTLRQMRAASDSYSELSHGAHHTNDDHAQPGTSTRHSPRHHPHADPKARENVQKQKLKSAPHSDIEFQAVNNEDDRPAASNAQQQPMQPKTPPTKQTEVKIVFPSMSPPSVDLTGREVIFAIAVFFFLSVSVGLVVVLVDKNIVEKTAQRQAEAKRLAEELERKRNPPREVCVTVDCLKASVQILEARNESASACSNFFEHACGGWKDSATIPSHRRYTSMTKEMEATVDRRLRKLLDHPLSSNQTDLGAEDKARFFYSRCMDTESIEEAGVTPFKREVNAMGGWAILEDWNIGEKSGLWNLQTVIRKLAFTYSVRPLFNMVIYDDTQPIELIPPELMHLTADDYLSNGTSPRLELYEALMEKIARLYGADRNATRKFVAATVQFETELSMIGAGGMMNMFTEGSEMTLKELSELAPRIRWEHFFQGAFSNMNEDTLISVPNPTYFANLSSLITQTDGRTLNYYLMWRFFTDFGGDLLSESFRLPLANFNKKVKGQKKVTNRSQFCVNSANQWISFIVGSLYVKEHFSPEQKSDIEGIARNVKKKFNDTLAEVAWLDDVSRAMVFEKLEHLNIIIGYHDGLADSAILDAHYDTFEVHMNMSYFDVAISGVMHSIRTMVAGYQHVNHAVSREWYQAPQAVGAFFYVTKNAINFPAGMLQLPFYHENNPRYINYATIGAIIGHEITHMFDASGSHFLADGSMGSIYSNVSRLAFDEKSGCYADYFEKVKMNVPHSDETWHVNGMMTLGETFADISGLEIALEAFYEEESQQRIKEELLPGLPSSVNQTFFLSFAQLYCTKIDEHQTRSVLDGDFGNTHPPGEIRVRGTLSQIKSFGTAFKCRRGSGMHPWSRCPQVWEQRKEEVEEEPAS